MHCAEAAGTGPACADGPDTGNAGGPSRTGAAARADGASLARRTGGRWRRRADSEPPRRSGTGAARWSLAVGVLRLPVQLVTQGVLARALGPENFGLFGLGLVVFLFAAFVSEFGFGILLYQREQVDAALLRFAVTWQLLIGIALALLLWVLAAPLAAAFGTAALGPVVQAMAVGCVFNGLACVPGIVLARQLRFGALSLVELASYVVGYAGVGIWGAHHGWGVQAMVAAWLTALVVKAALQWALAPVPARPRLRPPTGVAVLRHGLTVTLTNTANWLLANVDRIAAGRLLSLQGTGLYVAAGNLSNVAFNVLLGALQPALLSRGAQMRADLPQLQRAWLKVLGAVWGLMLPGFACLAVVAPDVVRILYGTRFDGAGGVLALGFALVPVYLTWGLSTPILWNASRGGLELKMQLPLLAAAVAAVAAAVIGHAGVGLMALAAGAATLVLARALVIVVVTGRAIALPLTRVAAIAARGAGVAGLVAAVLLLSAPLVEPRLDAVARVLAPGWVSLPALLHCAVAGLLAAVTVVLVLRFAPALAGAEAGDALRALSPRAARWLSPHGPAPAPGASV